MDADAPYGSGSAKGAWRALRYWSQVIWADSTVRIRAQAIEQALPKAMKLYRKPLAVAVQQSKDGINVPSGPPSARGPPRPADPDPTASPKPASSAVATTSSSAKPVKLDPAPVAASAPKSPGPDPAPAKTVGSAATPAPSFLATSSTTTEASRGAAADPVRRVV